MIRWIKLLCLLAFASSPALADTVLTWTGPSAPVFGDLEEFNIFSASVTIPSVGNVYSISVLTNYEVAIPNGSSTIPNGAYNSYTSGNHGSFDMGDFLFSWQGNFYGIAFSSHDNLQAGDFYQVAGFETSADVMNIPPGQQISPTAPAGIYGPRRDLPVWLDAFVNGSFHGAGTLSVSSLGDTTNGMYTITDSFTAPAGFLMQDGFTIDMSSFVCANGFLTGQADLTPEPASYLLAAPFLMLLGWRLFANRRVRATVPVGRS